VTPRGIDPARARRVLAIRHRAGGDLLLTTPAFHALRRGLPGARIEVLTARGLAGLLAGNPDVDRVLTFDRRSIGSQAALYTRLVRGGYDVVLDLVSNPRSAFLAALTRAPIRVGYDIPGRRWAYTLRLPREPMGSAGPVLRYAPEAALDQVRALGLPAAGTTLRFSVTPAAAAEFESWRREEGLHGGRPLVACLPAASWPAKTWPAERFVETMDALAAEAEVIWLWGPGERDLAEACRARMRAPSRLAPATDWQGLGALLARSALLVGNDSGPKHVAVALGTPTVTVFGPTHPATWHPPAGPHVALRAEGLACLHCNANVCPLGGEAHIRCMRDVGAPRVIEAARALLAGRSAEATCASL
jgi:ADP-heptose:LPS heptosyltransferase